MAKIISRVKEMGRNINRSRKEAGIGFKGGKLGLGYGFGVNVKQTNPSQFLPYRSSLYSYKRLDNLGKQKKSTKKKESYGKLTTTQVTYQKGGKQIVETYLPSNKKSLTNHPKKRIVKRSINLKKGQTKTRLNPYGFGLI